MKKPLIYRNRIILFCSILLFPFLIFAQQTSSQDSLKKPNQEEVIICPSEKFKAFHSHKECPGLDTCTDSLVFVTAEIAMENFTRQECCICWEDPLKDCKNDNPDYKVAEYDGNYEEEYDPDYEEPEEDRNDDLYVDDLWLLSDAAFFYLGVVVGSAVLLSNEVYIGRSYSFLPPKLIIDSDFDVESSWGLDILFRKNFKRDAFEYGLSYHNYELANESARPTRFDSRETFMFKLSYLHQLNQHFSTVNNSKERFNIYAGPMITFGLPDLGDELPVDKFGIGGTVVGSLKLGKRFHLDMRGSFTNFSSEVSVGIRWLYQKEYFWKR